VKVVVMVVVVFNPLPNSKANISQCTLTCGVEKIGHEWHLFHYWVSFPFNAMNYLSIVESFVYRWSSKNNFITLNDQKPKPSTPTSCMIANELSYLRRNKGAQVMCLHNLVR
jgi:hypothetical protein